MENKILTEEEYRQGNFVAQIIKNPADAKYLDGNRLWQGVPSIGVDKKSGRLWSVWMTGGKGEGPDTFLLLYTSADGGKSWQGPKVAIDMNLHPLRTFDGSLWQDPDGRLWCFFSQSYDYYDGIGGVWGIYTENPESDDPNWSAPQFIANGVSLNKAIALSNGDWLMAPYCWTIKIVAGTDENKTLPNPFLEKLGAEISANTYISKDKGKTWQYYGSVPGFEAERIYEMNDHLESILLEQNDGSLRMLIRTHLGVEESFSQDGGKTWCKAKYANICHVASRMHITRLASGNVLLIYNNPPDDGTVRSHLTAALSTDGGKTFPNKLLLDERENTTYPDAVQANDGTIYISYDCGRGCNGNILMAKITEDDIMAGKIVSENSALRMLINDNT